MLAWASPAAAAPSPTFGKPRLVLQITVDQFRGDLPTRYFDRLGKGGLRYLLEEGIHYNNAHHAHANTETIVGHVTLTTGAHPAAHGMIGNIWFDRRTGGHDLQHRAYQRGQVRLIYGRRWAGQSYRPFIRE